MPSTDWSFVTDEMFDRKLRDLVIAVGPDELLSVPGVYDCLKEYYNNDVLDLCKSERPDE